MVQIVLVYGRVQMAHPLGRENLLALGSLKPIKVWLFARKAIFCIVHVTFQKESLQGFLIFEKMGEKLPFLVGGLIMLEVSKLPDIIKGSPILDHKKEGIGVLEGFSKGQPKPVLEINSKNHL